MSTLISKVFFFSKLNTNKKLTACGRNHLLNSFIRERVSVREVWQTVKMAGSKSVLYMINILDMSQAPFFRVNDVICADREKKTAQPQMEKIHVAISKWK